MKHAVVPHGASQSPATGDLVARHRFELDAEPVAHPSRRGLVPRADLPALIEQLEAMIVPAPDEQLRLAVARLTGSFPNLAPHSPEGYVAALLEELQSYPLDVLVEALREIRRTLKFPPAVAEVVEVCERFMSPRRRRLANARAMVHCHAEADRLIAENIRARAEAERRRAEGAHLMALLDKLNAVKQYQAVDWYKAHRIRFGIAAAQNRGMPEADQLALLKAALGTEDHDALQQLDRLSDTEAHHEVAQD